jgi:hypothetical protein
MRAGPFVQTTSQIRVGDYVELYGECQMPSFFFGMSLALLCRMLKAPHRLSG